MFPALIKIAAAGCKGPVKIELLKGEGQLIDVGGQRCGVHCCVVSLIMVSSCVKRPDVKCDIIKR